MSLSFKVAEQVIERCLMNKLVAMLWGSPGTGKSALVKGLSKKYRLKLIDIRLAQCDPVDLCGFPKLDGNKGTYVPMDTFPIKGDKVPEGYDGWLIFMDELSSAPRATQAAAYKIILDRMVGSLELHEKCLVVAAGNKISDNAIAEEMSTALQSRMIHLELEPNIIEWLNWAYSVGMDQRITDYLKFRPDHLYTFKPHHTDHTYACNRTWEFAHMLIQGDDLSDSDFALALLAGTLSKGVAMEFITYLEIYKEVPNKDMILKFPESAPIPRENGVLAALTGMIAAYMEASTAEALMKYLERLPLEFQTVTMREIKNRKPALFSKTPVFANWLFKNSSELV